MWGIYNITHLLMNHIPCRYNMPLFEVVGVTCTWHNYHVCAAFMSSEQEKSYMWVLSRMKEMLSEDPVAIVTDRNLALMEAVEKVFPYSKYVLCREHIRRNIEDRVKTNASVDVCNSFVWEALHLFESTTELEYLQRLNTMRAKWKNS